MKEKNINLLWLLGLLIIVPLRTQAALYFHAYTVDKDSRTGLSLTPDGPLSLHGGFTLSFDLEIRPERELFGYVFRIVGNETSSLDLLSDLLNDRMLLVARDSVALRFTSSEIAKERPVNRWMHVEVTLAGDKLSCSFNGVQKSTVCPGFSRLNAFRFFFGWNNYKAFTTTDVPPILLKNLRIYNAGHRLLRFWKMGRHSEACVYDECRQARAEVRNGNWQIDRHVYWQKLAGFSLAGHFPKIAFDAKGKRLFAASQKAVYEYMLDSASLRKIAVKGGVPYNEDFDYMFYEEDSDALLTYDFNKSRPARFNFRTREWDNTDTTFTLSYYGHHAGYFDQRRHLIYTLGGYGWHQYSSQLQMLPENGGGWRRKDLSSVIPPRYLAAMGVWRDSLLLYFGGYGSSSGKQYEGTHNFYDLYIVDPQRQQAVKCWQLQTPERGFTNSNSLIADKSRNVFYALAYPNNQYETYIRLHAYKIDAPSYRDMGDSIPFLFNDNGSGCTLFIPADSSELLAVVNYQTGLKSHIDLYALAYPPLSRADTLQTAPSHHNRRLFLLGGACTLCCLALAGVFFIFFSRRKRNGTPATAEATAAPIPTLPPTKPDAPLRMPFIHLFGGFRVIDRQGADITDKFTPTTRQVFLLLLLRTLDGGKGITSRELQKTLWPDKDNESARNSRNVYYNKLRGLLGGLGEMKICNTNNVWTLDYDREAIACDYATIQACMADLGKAGQEPRREVLTLLLRTAKRGLLLPYCEYEWLDTYKTDYVSRLL
ncbi:MAG: hypothetical protein LBL81_03055, partial [Tannerella sp.]|nr:hypothetical protein [Tannerella sp.]